MDKPKIGVLGGSFNPPTIAHKLLLEDAVSQLHLQKGIFVPSSHKYVERKMSGEGYVYPEPIRYTMLARIVEESYVNLDVCGIEFGDDGKGNTYRTLCRLRSRIQREIKEDILHLVYGEEYGEGFDLCFIIGSDKLNIIPRWRDREKLLSEFNLIVILRKEEDRETLLHQLKQHPCYREHLNHLLILRPKHEMKEISSTAVREAIKEQKPWDEIAAMVSASTLGLLQRIHKMKEK